MLTCFRNGFATVFEQSIVVKTMEETTKVLVGVGCMFFVFWCFGAAARRCTSTTNAARRYSRNYKYRLIGLRCHLHVICMSVTVSYL